MTIVYQYMNISLSREGIKHHTFQLGFYSNSCFTSEKLIHRLNLQPGRSVCSFDLVLHF